MLKKGVYRTKMSRFKLTADHLRLILDLKMNLKHKNSGPFIFPFLGSRGYFLVQRLHICAAQTSKCAVTCAVQIFKDFCAVTCVAQTLIFLYWRKERKFSLWTIYIQNSCKIYRWSLSDTWCNYYDNNISYTTSSSRDTKKIREYFCLLDFRQYRPFQRKPLKVRVSTI